MKILCKGDQHLRANKPKNRTDNFYEAQLKKHEFIFQYALENQIDLIIQPGDFFDSPKVPFFVLSDYIKLKRKYEFPAYIPEIAVFAQHDLFFHSKKDSHSTPLGLFMQVGLVHEPPYKKEGVHIYGASWEEQIPEIQDPDVCNVLVTHRMVIKDDLLWEGQSDFERASVLLRLHKFDLIVAGDNHQCFSHEYRGRFLVNAGSILRTSTNQHQHTPSFFVYDTEERSITKIMIPHEENVFSLDLQEREKSVNSEVQVFIDEIQKKSYQDFSFRRNLFIAMKEASQDVQETLKIILKRSGLYEQFKEEQLESDSRDSGGDERDSGGGKKDKGQVGLGIRKLRRQTQRRV